MAYLSSYRGDPGFFGAIGGVLKKVGGVAIDVLPGPVGAVARTARRALGSSSRPAPTQVSFPGGLRRLTGTTITTRLPFGGSQTKTAAPVRINPNTGQPVKRRRRMNVTNDKALRRAIRRQTGFVKLARKALQGTGYKIVSKGSSRPRVVKESGPGSVTIQ